MPFPTTRPNAVKPPSTESSEVLLARFTNHWLVALFGWPPIRAIAIVPVVFERQGSFGTGGSVGIAE